jgi:hypothetical protein
MTSEVKKPGAVTQKILNFKDKIARPDKSAETMSLDSAVWYVEAALNLTYDELNNAEIIKTDSVYVSVSAINSGIVDLYDVAAAYNKFDQEINDIYSQTTSSNLYLQFADVSVTNTNPDSTTMLLVAAFSNDRPLLELFDVTEYWRAWGNQGKCGQFNGQYIGRDATTELSLVANCRRAVPEGTGFYTNVCTGYIDNTDSPGSFYSAEGPNPVPAYAPCLSPSDMNFWCQKILTIGKNQIVAHQVVILNYNVDAEVVSNDVSPYWFAEHHLHLTTGHWNPTTPSEL